MTQIIQVFSLMRLPECRARRARLSVLNQAADTLVARAARPTYLNHLRHRRSIVFNTLFNEHLSQRGQRSAAVLVKCFALLLDE